MQASLLEAARKKEIEKHPELAELLEGFLKDIKIMCSRFHAHQNEDKHRSDRSGPKP